MYGVSGTIVYISPVFFRVRIGYPSAVPNVANSGVASSSSNSKSTAPTPSYSPAITLTRPEYSSLLALQQRWEEQMLDEIGRNEIEMTSLEAILDYLGYDADDPVTLLLTVSDPHVVLHRYLSFQRLNKYCHSL